MIKKDYFLYEPNNKQIIIWSQSENVLQDCVLKPNLQLSLRIILNNSVLGAVIILKHFVSTCRYILILLDFHLGNVVLAENRTLLEWLEHRSTPAHGRSISIHYLSMYVTWNEYTGPAQVNFISTNTEAKRLFIWLLEEITYALREHNLKLNQGETLNMYPRTVLHFAPAV